MHRCILIALAVLLALAGSAAAQDGAISEWERDNPKTIPAIVSLGCRHLSWGEPYLKPDSYRIRWGINGSFISWKKPNKGYRGNAFVDGDTRSFRLSVPIKSGKTQHVQIRARYNGEKNGPWITHEFCAARS